MHLTEKNKNKTIDNSDIGTRKGWSIVTLGK